MRVPTVIAAYAALVVAQDLDINLVQAAEPVPTATIPVVYSYSANYADPSASITTAAVDYNPSAAAASVYEGVIASATEEATAAATGSVSKRAATGSCAALAAAGKTLTSSAGTAYTVQCGYDYPGYDLASASASTFSDCYTKCDAYPGCVSFAYVPGTCYLKRLGAVATANSGVSAGALVNMPTTNPNLCVAQPTGISHVSNPDTASGFQADAYYASAASQAPVPSGYTPAFTNLQASNNALGYLGYSLLSTYDTATCAQRCNAVSGCSAINVYFERDPSVDPNDSSCSNPSSYTQVKCVYWGGPVTTGNAVNNGQWRNQFQVVMAGSNGYVNNSIVTPVGYTAPAYLGKTAISAPALDCVGNSPSLQSFIWTSGPFDARLCSTACSAYSSATNGQNCQFFNTYVLYANGIDKGQYCQLYSASFGTTFATDSGSTVGGIKYTYGYSFSSSNATNPGGPAIPCNVAAASSAIVSATLQPYCSTLLGYFPMTTTVSATTLVTAQTTVTVVATTDFVTVTQVPAKRALATPTALTAYPSSVISSACSLLATPVTTTATYTATTIISTAATSVATTLVTLTSTVTVSAPTITPGPFQIISAFWEDVDVTQAARNAYLQGDNVQAGTGNTMVLDVTIIGLLNAFGQDPWPGVVKSLNILYSYNGEMRLWQTLDGAGVFTINPGPLSSAPNSAALYVNTPPAGALINIVTAAWAQWQISYDSVYSGLYGYADNGVTWPVQWTFFGYDPRPGNAKSVLVWYTVGSDPTLRVLHAKENTYATFDTSP